MVCLVVGMVKVIDLLGWVVFDDNIVLLIGLFIDNLIIFCYCVMELIFNL